MKRRIRRLQVLAGDRKSVFYGKLPGPCIAEILNQVSLLVGAQHQVNTLYLAHVLRLQLRVAAGDDDEGTRILSHHAMDSLTALMIGNFCYRASIDETNVCFLPLLCRNDAHIFEHLAESGSFREIEFAAQRIVGCLFALEGT